MYPDDFLQRKLEARKQEGSLRALRIENDKVDFCSNDYLGIVKNAKLQIPDPRLSHGSTGSRLLSGNNTLIEQVEKEIAMFHNSGSALLFNSGYDANTGLLSCVPQKGDTILYDHLCHASLRDGMRLSFAQSFSFAHNDLGELEEKLQRTTGNVFIVTESVFSMDGDQCPLEELATLAGKFKAHLIIDEAHATGVTGERGEGLVQHLGMEQSVFARVHTFGKACGCHGAVVLGSATLKEYLVNFARSFVYTTALPPQTVAAIQNSYSVFPLMHEERAHLNKLISQFRTVPVAYEKIDSLTPIQGVVVPGNENVKALAEKLQSNGFDVRPILYPTVPKGKERLRIVIHAFNTEEELAELLALLK